MAAERSLTPFEQAVFDVLNGTGPGDVLSYGDVAAEAGYPGAARAVGNVLAHSEGLGLPWWRVVTASGRLIPHDAELQARLLGSEGITCRQGRVVAGRPDGKMAGRPDGKAAGRHDGKVAGRPDGKAAGRGGGR